MNSIVNLLATRLVPLNHMIKPLALAVTVTVLTVGILTYLVYDPTMSPHDANARINFVINTEMPANVRVTEVRSEPAVPSKNPFWVRYHPRNLKRPQNGLSGTANGSWAYLIECQQGKIRCYSHFFRGYTSAFTILYQADTKADAKLLAEKLRNAFPLLPVTIQESSTLTIEEPKTELYQRAALISSLQPQRQMRPYWYMAFVIV